MELRVLSTSDSHEDAGNSEDEVYYGMSGFTVRSGKVKHLPKKVVRPSNPSKDVWEMGSGSNSRLTRLPFAANMKLLDSVGILLVISEQDNVWAPSGSSNFQKINNAVSALKQALSGDEFLATNTGVDDATLDSVIADMGICSSQAPPARTSPLVWLPSVPGVRRSR